MPPRFDYLSMLFTAQQRGRSMNLKNYTSSVPVERSVMNIEHHLVRAGAGHIAKSYDTNGVLTGITFQIVKGNVNTVFKLPAKWEKCFEVMFKEVRKPRPETRERVKEQAQRTAWKILHDWVEIQVSLIQLEQ